MKKKKLFNTDVRGARAVMRVDFNVPLESGRVTDDLRIRAALPGVNYVIENGGSLVLMSHLGRPKGHDPALSMKVVGEALSGLAGVAVKTAPGCIEPEVAEMAKDLKPGEILLLENLRFYPGEKKADEEFAKKLAAMGELFVGDAFGTAHRGDASVAVVPRFMPDAVAGPLMAREIDAFSRVLVDPARPFLAVLGGAKVSDKIPVIENLLDKVNVILIGGGMAYTFLKAQGRQIGNSKLEADLLETASQILGKAEAAGVEVLLPTDHAGAREFDAGAEAKAFSSDVEEGWMGLDIGPETAATFAGKIGAAGTVVWNGPMGVFEFDAFSAGSKAVARAMAETNGFTVVGGGDTAAAVEEFGLAAKMDHVSTGGGASLALLGGQPLPGIDALNDA